jgi:hypothetical protein
LALPWGQPVYDAAALATGRARSDASPNSVRQRVRVRYPHLRWFPGCFTRPTGDLDLQLSRRTDHVETWSPPYVCPNSVSGARRNGTLGSVVAPKPPN